MRKQRLKLTNDTKESCSLELKQQKNTTSLWFENPSTVRLGEIYGKTFLAGSSI